MESAGLHEPLPVLGRGGAVAGRGATHEGARRRYFLELQG